MCGIFGNISIVGASPSLTEAQAVRLRDMLAHRGPDGAGLWSRENALLAHRRLAVLDTSDAGAQPMLTPDKRYALVYNGEIYNEPALRRELESLGVRFRSRCDTETLLHALAKWGTTALTKLRGMFAFAFYDTREHTLLLARDAMGVKPLYFFADGREVVFASEVAPIVSHPRVGAAPNLAMCSAYLTTIRTVLGNDTLFEGVHALAPGQMALVDFNGTAPVLEIRDWWAGPRTGGECEEDDAALRTREALAASVEAHLRADVPTCALLSGGLDSSATSLLASAMHGSLRTYCAGAAPEDGAPAGERTDLTVAREVADFLGTMHSEAHITRAHFNERWPEMVSRLGVPLSTPNEVAILAVAERLRADGCVVTISGEGADELFGGYAPPMLAAHDFLRTRRGAAGASGGRFQLESNAWAPPAIKGAILREDVWDAVGRDRPLIAWFEREFARCAEEAGDDGLAAHLRFHRRVNLTGLLQRLDTATMLAGVEGRTPFADPEMATLAESLPMSCRFSVEEGADEGGGLAVATRVRTKIALREAFRAELPASVVDRPKASFPLPFEQWIADQGHALRRSALARELFTEGVVEAVAADPSANWRLAWPMLNLAIWGQRWWG